MTTWALAVATYERPEMLRRCVRAAINQTRPPAEVVVVDASCDHERNRGLIEAEVAGRVPLVYEPADRPSAAAQRNRAAGLASADVVFLIDDDSLLYPDAAAKVMEVYDRDAEGEVAGVAPLLAAAPPDVEVAGGGEREEVAPPEPPSAAAGRAARLARRLLSADDLFVPYDADFPRREVPAALRELPVAPRPLMAGFSMTCRRAAILAEPFEELLADRGPEDSDVSYRLSRRGLLLSRLDARLHHAAEPAGRFGSYRRQVLDLLGPCVLHRLYSSDLARSRRRQRAITLRRTLIGLLKDARAADPRLPRLRGGLAALRHGERVLRLPEPAARAWYAEYQRKLMA